MLVPGAEVGIGVQIERLPRGCRSFRRIANLIRGNYRTVRNNEVGSSFSPSRNLRECRKVVLNKFPVTSGVQVNI